MVTLALGLPRDLTAQTLSCDMSGVEKAEQLDEHYKTCEIAYAIDKIVTYVGDGVSSAEAFKEAVSTTTSSELSKLSTEIGSVKGSRGALSAGTTSASGGIDTEKLAELVKHLFKQMRALDQALERSVPHGAAPDVVRDACDAKKAFERAGVWRRRIDKMLEQCKKSSESSSGGGTGNVEDAVSNDP